MAPFGFDKINNQLFNDSFKAHAYANILGPIIQNIGNILYVIIATCGGLFLVTGAKNLSLSGMAFSISIVVPFLNMTKQFTGNINQVSQQINAIVMGLAGADRLFRLMDEEPEADEGYVTLVNSDVDSSGNIIESENRTGKWAWKHPHSDGTVTYTPLMGDVTLNEVDFAYVEGYAFVNIACLFAEVHEVVRNGVVGCFGFFVVHSLFIYYICMFFCSFELLEISSLHTAWPFHIIPWLVA